MQIVIIGVSGCGKTSVGQALAKKLNLPFRDADEFHSVANKEKMSRGQPLTDEDRIPWLLAIHKHMQKLDSQNKDGVVTCSGLKKMYRQVLLEGTATDDPNSHSLPKKNMNKSSVLFVLLHGKEEVLQSRMNSRKDHFMPSSLLPSQLATLEHPDETEHFIIVDIDNSVDDIVSQIIKVIQAS
ncbi:probable gluconokinase [Mizuhopecten yessoensis]|uniref:Gluconokinase n=1 Tax=Mizuhopecten yessoensis TaxID=6573 RepID=A0A210QZC1_MIZYE|nr:probable gluconokinase [Mizuhopecten yessoensis]XP_021346094.1 probable gluconokinase [Mizuhopecten yessoensis]XP_021346095.1 probable gluconokinase [Mizuhopecten yessoensis]XP_021346097.1 probable gluconokinase [Mizuhopecten yessoensis]XP_021346098.1 probable gluconokinase [Mizuhopecten yessoensis]XP_021346099.1 probable gluconokinase [Mizuhopecten yessoensis]OWF54096.1 gluconokinase [Mizuhopecten yessoensis]